MKVSIITVVYNAEKYIKDCVESVINQTYPAIEYIIIDGGSTDQTLAIIEGYKDNLAHFISERDKGIYDAINKGIKLASGEVVGILNADDMLASPTVIEKIVTAFKINSADAVYGNLNYVDANDKAKVIRKWVSKQFVEKDFKYGWMPAHPTLYLKKECYERYGTYSLDFGTAADYELMIRLLYKHHVKAIFLNQLIVNMRIGGISNSSNKQRYLAAKNDYKALKVNRVPIPLVSLLFKKLSKIAQYFH